MNAVVPGGFGGGKGPKNPRAVLAIIEPYLQPSRALRHPWVVYVRDARDWEFERRFDAYGPEASVEEMKPVALELWADVPSLEFLDDLERVLDLALAQSVGLREAEVFAAVLLDGPPNANPASPMTYRDAIIYSLVEREQKPPGPHVLAAAVIRSWQTRNFSPTPKEFIETVEVVRAQFERGLLLVPAMRDLRKVVRYFLEDVGEIEPEPGQFSQDFFDAPF
jgi:hypothetical protein